MNFYRRLPKVAKDLIVFNSFILMVQFIMNYGLNKEFVIRSEALFGANIALLIVYLFRYRVDKIRAEERGKKDSKQ